MQPQEEQISVSRQLLLFLAIKIASENVVLYGMVLL